MPLFIDRLPFQSWIDQTRTPPQDYWTAVVPVQVTEPELSAPPVNAPIQYWVLDTGHRGEAFCWRQHLQSAGLDPTVRLFPARVGITTALGGKEYVPVRNAHLWLVSNLPALRKTPFLLTLHRGIPFRNVPTLPDPHFHRPLLGLKAMRRAGLRVELDCFQDTVSIWTPDSPRQLP